LGDYTTRNYVTTKQSTSIITNCIIVLQTLRHEAPVVYLLHRLSSDYDLYDYGSTLGCYSLHFKSKMSNDHGSMVI